MSEHQVAFAGDWHGDLAWAQARIHDVAKRDVSTLLHVGDVGIWPGDSGKRFLRGVEEVCARFGVNILVTPGNHEDWDRLTRLWANPKRRGTDGRPTPVNLTDHVQVLPRGCRWEIAGVSFVSLGGAPSVDRAWRTEGRTWWPEEAITDDHVERVSAGGYADVMITHDGPDHPYQVPRVAHICATNPHDFPLEDLAYAAEGRRRLQRAFQGVAPRLLVHGHYHADGEATVRLPDRDYDTTVWALGCNGQVGNLRFLDLSTIGGEPRA